MRKKSISIGDSVYVCVKQSGCKIFERVFQKVGSLTDLISGVRKLMRSYSGLVKIYIRNMTRGWSEERPLMFYGNERESRLYSRLVKINRHIATA